MKFFQLRDQLSKALAKPNEPKPNVSLPKPAPTVPAVSHPPRPSPGREKVAGGTVIWKPVDKTTAMVVAKAPWWAHPPPISGQPAITEPKPKKKRMKHVNHGHSLPESGNDPYSAVITRQTEGEFVEGVEKEFARRTKATISLANDLTEQAIDARAAMEQMTEKYKVAWVDFQSESSQRLREFRATRMAMDSEIRQLVAGLREIRQFFIDKDYEKERERLKEFVEICERLQKLKDSGFLDSVADTMLRLSLTQ